MCLAKVKVAVHVEEGRKEYEDLNVLTVSWKTNISSSVTKGVQTVVSVALPAMYVVGTIAISASLYILQAGQHKRRSMFHKEYSLIALL